MMCSAAGGQSPVTGRTRAGLPQRPSSAGAPLTFSQVAGAGSTGYLPVLAGLRRIALGLLGFFVTEACGGK